ncbi:MAG: DUF167 domain-containing protein [Phycisphaerales bacterium]|nr:DUF167 domain-containing protein [Phycisphaerales bacterium]
MPPIESRDGEIHLHVKAVPGASRTRCLGQFGDRIRIAVAAPPEKGKANKTLVAFLADALNLRKQDVAVIAGLTSPLKTVSIRDATPDRVRTALGL